MFFIFYSGLLTFLVLFSLFFFSILNSSNFFPISRKYSPPRYNELGGKPGGRRSLRHGANHPTAGIPDREYCRLRLASEQREHLACHGYPE